MGLTALGIFIRQATGGSIPGVIPRLSDAELNVTQSINNTGNVSTLILFSVCDLTYDPFAQMFEKLNTVDVDSSGSGGKLSSFDLPTLFVLKLLSLPTRGIHCPSKVSLLLHITHL